MLARLLPLLLLLAPVRAFAQAPADADALGEQMRRLGSNPQDLDALLTAGELSVKLEDFSAAGAFFARAEKVDARNARAKAGEGAILVHAERPVEALRYFAMAEQLGLAPARFAGERGLAYDLLGDPGRAQRDYQAALAAGGDAEVRRRYALSLGIAGRQAQALAELDPLIRQNDRAAWRSRAFVLAMGGDAVGATRIAETMMPPGSATALQGFFAQLPRLSPVDKAFAVHFGEVQATPQRLADARLPHEAPLPVVVPPSVAVQMPAVGPVGDRRNRRDRNRRNEIQVAAIALPPLPLPPAYEAPVYAPPVAATPLRDRPLTAGEQAALTAGGNRAAPVRSRRGQTFTAPVVTRALTPDEQRSLAAVAGSRDGTSSRRPDIAPIRPALPAAERPAITAAPIRADIAQVVPPVVPALPGATAPAVTRALTAGEQASLTAAAGPPPRPVAAAGVAPGFSTVVAAPSVGETPVAAVQPRAIPVLRQRSSRRAAYAQADSVLSRIVAGLTIPAAELDVAPASAPSRRRAAAALKAAADRKAAVEAKAEADRDAAEQRRLARAEPARIWVQIASGGNEDGLIAAWRTMRGTAPQVLTGRTGWTAPLRSLYRVLTGPFRTQAEALAVVNRLSAAGVPAFTFTSEAGQKITRLPQQ